MTSVSAQRCRGWRLVNASHAAVTDSGPVISSFIVEPLENSLRTTLPQKDQATDRKEGRFFEKTFPRWFRRTLAPSTTPVRRGSGTRPARTWAYGLYLAMPESLAPCDRCGIAIDSAQLYLTI